MKSQMSESQTKIMITLIYAYDTNPYDTSLGSNQAES